jgi:ferredoxin
VRAVIDEDPCRGHGICCVTCPEVFALTDDGYSEVREPEVQPAGRCPEHAIVVT